MPLNRWNLIIFEPGDKEGKPAPPKEKPKPKPKPDKKKDGK